MVLRGRWLYGGGAVPMERERVGCINRTAQFIVVISDLNQEQEEVKSTARAGLDMRR